MFVSTPYVIRVFFPSLSVPRSVHPAGFRAKNRFGSLKADSDIFLTFEGDNTVLMQQVARYVVNTVNDMRRARRFWDDITGAAAQ